MSHKATIKRSFFCGRGQYDEEIFKEATVDSFDEALALCRSCGCLGGLIEDSGVEFDEIDADEMTATFRLTKRMRYAGDLFDLYVVK